MYKYVSLDRIANGSDWYIRFVNLIIPDSVPSTILHIFLTLFIFLSKCTRMHKKGMNGHLSQVRSEAKSSMFKWGSFTTRSLCIPLLLNIKFSIM